MSQETLIPSAAPAPENPPAPEQERHRFISAFPGNHPEVIRDALLRRGNFVEVSRVSTQY